MAARRSGDHRDGRAMPWPRHWQATPPQAAPQPSIPWRR